MNKQQYIMEYDSPIGALTISSDGENITGLWIKDQKYYVRTLGNRFISEASLPIFSRVTEWLDRYFKSENPQMSLPLAPGGASVFRNAVWDILMAIPYGEVTTYGKIAKLLEKKADGKRVSAQAVGGAVGHNPISILIPCHRVVGANGSLTGYAAGIPKKIRLLELEGVSTDQLFIPGKGSAL